jgi:hypothetical protein
MRTVGWASVRECPPELGVPAVNRTDVIEFDFGAQIFLKPFEQEPTAAEQLTRSAALWLPWATASPITRTTKGRASVMLASSVDVHLPDLGDGAGAGEDHRVVDLL